MFAIVVPISPAVFTTVAFCTALSLWNSPIIYGTLRDVTHGHRNASYLSIQHAVAALATGGPQLSRVMRNAKVIFALRRGFILKSLTALAKLPRHCSASAAIRHAEVACACVAKETSPAV
jgi:hypothetical protein